MTIALLVLLSGVIQTAELGALPRALAVRSRLIRPWRAYSLRVRSLCRPKQVRGSLVVWRQAACLNLHIHLRWCFLLLILALILLGLAWSAQAHCRCLPWSFLSIWSLVSRGFAYPQPFCEKLPLTIYEAWINLDALGLKQVSINRKPRAVLT